MIIAEAQSYEVALRLGQAAQREFPDERVVIKWPGYTISSGRAGATGKAERAFTSSFSASTGGIK